MTDISLLIERWIRADIRALNAYHVPPAQGLIKLDAMENPYGWPPELAAQWRERLAGAAINRYPDPAATELKAQLRRVMGIAEGQDILLGNGSDELIQILALAVAGPGEGKARTVLAPEPCFVMYRMIATYAGLDYVGVPLDADFDLDVPAMLAAIERHRPALIYLALPNNPTGNLFSADRLAAVIAAAPGLVVLDEAYMAFTDADHLHLAAEKPNVLVMRTLSKVGLAGLRLGLLVGDPRWIEELDKLRLPYNINVLTQLTATLALEHYDVFRQQTASIRAERARMMTELCALPGLRPWPSEANFILVTCPQGRARDIHQALLARGLLVKCLDGSHPALGHCLRLTIGSDGENTRLLAELRDIMSNSAPASAS